VGTIYYQRTFIKQPAANFISSSRFPEEGTKTESRFSEIAESFSSDPGGRQYGIDA